MKKVLLLSLALSSALPLTAMAIESNGSCFIAAESTCVEYTGTGYAGAGEAIRAACEEQQGTFGVGACPAENRVAGCLLDGDTQTEYSISFYAPYTVEQTQMMCQLVGGRQLP